MESGTELKKDNDPYDNLFMEINENRLTRGAPLLLQNSFANELSINLPSSLGEFRLGVVSNGQPPKLEPATNEWVKPEVGQLNWLITPASAEDPFTLVLYGRNFSETLEFHCEPYAADHPWYTSSRFYVVTPDNNGFFAHRGNLPISKTEFEYLIQLHTVGGSLIGENIKLTFTGPDGVPTATPVEARPMGNISLGWRFSFAELGKLVPVTAWFEGDGLEAKTSFDFRPL